MPGQTGAGGMDAYVRGYDPDGNELWTRQFGSAEMDYGLRNAVDSTGIYVVGQAGGALPGQTASGTEDAFLVKLPLSTIIGIVTDSSRGRPVRGVLVETDSGLSTTTDRRGAYTLKGAPPGLQMVTASKTGYATQPRQTMVTAGSTSKLDFVLESAKKSGGGGPDCEKKPNHPKCP